MTQTQTIIGTQCARCGSSLTFQPCETCHACGWYDRPDPDCFACEGSGRVAFCLADAQWCATMPLPGRESVKRHTVESFEVAPP